MKLFMQPPKPAPILTDDQVHDVLRRFLHHHDDHELEAWLVQIHRRTHYQAQAIISKFRGRNATT